MGNPCAEIPLEPYERSCWDVWLAPDGYQLCIQFRPHPPRTFTIPKTLPTPQIYNRGFDMVKWIEIPTVKAWILDMFGLYDRADDPT